VIKASQRLYLRWHSFPTSLKSLLIKGAEDLKKNKKQQDSVFFLCQNSMKSNSARHLGFIFKFYILEILRSESVHLFSLHLLVRKIVTTKASCHSGYFGLLGVAGRKKEA